MAGRYRAYPAYKPSGVEWLGNIPEGWETFHFKRTVDGCVNGFWGDNPNGGTNDTIVVRVADFDRPKLSLVDEGYSVRSIRPSEKANRKLNYGDLLIEKSGGGEKTLVGQVVQFQKRFEAVTSNFVAKMSPRKHFDSSFLTYAFHSAYSINLNLRSVKQNTGIQNLDSNAYLCEIWTFPPLFEQIQIAAFLDHETAKIDALIAKQERLIALLEEKRQAVISHAVTKGLNPKAPLRHPGIDWLGDVPAHWETRNVSKLTTKITNGYVGPTRDILVDEGIPYIQATHIKRGKVNFDDAYFVRDGWSNKHAKSILKPEDVLIVQTGAGTGDVACVTSNEEGYNCHALIILTPMQGVISGRYLAFALRSQYGQAVLYSIRTGGMHPHLNCGEVQYVALPVPPISEQLEIAEFIDDQTKAFDEMNLKAQSAITLLKERRTALISAAVTGKIDVRDWQAPSVIPTQDTSQDA
ncbi:MAG: restriction endonuclease subunit S [Sulfitobacter sp.]